MPFQLRVLGETALRTTDGSSLDALLAQPKRFALLTYLLVDPPPRLHRREALLLRFWPEFDEAHARGALSQALSFLRRHLGEEAVVTRGTEEVGLNHALFESDAARFEALAEAGEDQRALARYGGDLLPGFHLDGCNEFDDWLAAERARLRARAVRCAKAVSRAAEASGDQSLAVVAARHALLLEPLDESAAGRAIRALALAGRPALAVAEYEAFRIRLQQELGLEPSAGLRALIERVRTTGQP